MTEKTNIIWHKRSVGGYRYIQCPECKTELQTEKPSHLDMPYCGVCGMSIADLAHKFCGWCGVELEYTPAPRGDDGE